MASGPAAPGQPLIPPARGCRKQGAAFSTAIPKLSAGQAREPRPRQLCPQAAGKGQEGSGGRQHFSSFITCPDPPATFLLPAPQGRGVPGPAHSCRGLLLPRTHLRPSLILLRTHLPCPQGCSQLTGTVSSIPKHKTCCFPQQWHHFVLQFPSAEKHQRCSGPVSRGKEEQAGDAPQGSLCLTAPREPWHGLWQGEPPLASRGEARAARGSSCSAQILSRH